MTTTTPPADSARPRPRALPRPLAARGAGGFTLTEVLIAATLSSFVLAGVLSTFLLLGRVGLGASSYVETSSRLRSAVERFSQDASSATAVRWENDRSLSLTLPSGGAVTYAIGPTSGGTTTLRRTLGDGVEQVLARDLTEASRFARLRLPAQPAADSPATSDLDTALLELRLEAAPPRNQTPASGALSLSARCRLRNKGAGT